MFSALVNLKTNQTKTPVVEETTLDVPKVVTAADKRKKVLAHTKTRVMTLDKKHALAEKKLTTSLDRLSCVVKDYVDLRRVRRLIVAGGMNKSIMTFVNPPKGGLNKLIPNLPAVESLDYVVIDRTDVRAKIAIEEMDNVLDTEPHVVADGIRSCSDTLHMYMSSSEEKLKSIGMMISHYIGELEGSDIPDGSESTCQTEAMPYDMVMSCIQALMDTIPEMDVVVSDQMDQAAVDAHKQKMADLVAKMGEHTGCYIDPSNPHQLCASDTLPLTHTPVAGSLSELGYDKEKVIDLLKKADAVIDMAMGLVGRKQDIMQHFNEVADRVEFIDNSVPPAGEEMVDDDDMDMDDIDTGMTQVDMVHAHVSSHCCCVTATVDACISAVQNVLCVADCYDSMDQSDKMGDMDESGDYVEQDDMA